ncbi:unnamed protein product [Chrysodeixis includens]|uniref:Tektin n=1 Tax=Chrysodeixis includens TaxID=689277 RepID=A0A9P0FW19_CHRIL|nr:unnamed protein product [Chrysodeixis includens]
MIAENRYLGCPHGFEDLKNLNDRLSAKVVEQVNDTQELVMLNNFAHESNEYQFKKCLEDRISDIASWRWVLDDLTKRLGDGIDTLQYEHNALRVVIERIQNEVDIHSREASQPGALRPQTDTVEQVILQEYEFLRDEKKKFEKLLLILDQQIVGMEKTKKKILVDILHKDQALSIEEACANIKAPESTSRTGDFNRRKKKKKGSPVTRWENRCVALKKDGLKALSNAIVTRQQVRGARVHLSITAQAHSARVDSALRRRLNTNKVKLQDLYWQKEEAMRDYKSLSEEQNATEQNLMETMEQERIIEARLADRTLRPPGELTRDEVDRKLRDELGRLRSFSKELRTTHDRISSLQCNLTDSIARLDSYAADIMTVVRLDEERIASRLGEVANEYPCAPTPPPDIYQMEPCPCDMSDDHYRSRKAASLKSIQEEDEEDDDYPLDH